jgi:hypothetical protein
MPSGRSCQKTPHARSNNRRYIRRPEYQTSIDRSSNSSISIGYKSGKSSKAFLKETDKHKQLSI